MVNGIENVMHTEACMYIVRVYVLVGRDECDV